MTRVRFLRALFVTGYIDLRAILNGNVKTTFIAVDHPVHVDRFIERYADRNIYVGVSERLTKNNGKQENCSYLRALFADIDLKDYNGDETAALQKLKRFASVLPPNIIVRSGGGWHLYWLLAEPIGLQQEGAAQTAKDLLRRLAIAVGGDLNSAEPAHILRLPETKNFKYDPPRDVAIERFSDEERVPLSSMEAVLDLFPETRVEKKTKKTNAQVAVVIPEHTRNDTLFRKACSLRHAGHSEAEILSLITTMNEERCHPPLPQPEVQQIAQSAMRYEPSENVEIKEVDPNELAKPVVEPYNFQPAFGDGHFVTEWIAHFSAQCDAALEYHEAAALIALSMVTHGMKVRISGANEPLRTNLYVALIGPSTSSRKSTAKDYATGIAKRMPDACAVLPEMVSHEGMVEALSNASFRAALMSVDEIKPLLDKLTHAQHLAGLKGLILEMYGRTDYTYQRVSKRKKNRDGESEREEDGFHAHDVTLSILGCCTESVFENLSSEIVESGLMPRFAIVWPTGKPERKARFQLVEGHEPNALIQRLHEIARRTSRCEVQFAEGVLELLDREVDLPIEQDANAGLMVKRLPVMAQKLAMLSAAGRLDAFEELHVPRTGQEDDLFTATPSIYRAIVTLDDARAAIAVIHRWSAGAKRFEECLGTSEFERKVEKCLGMVKGRQGHVNRRVIARRVKLSAKDMREIEETLKLRGHIEVVVQSHAKGAPPKVFWRWVE